MEVKNQRGDVIGKIQFQTTVDQGEIQRIILDLAPGEGKGIYIADAVDNNFTQQTNYAARDWDADLDALREKLHPWKPRFPTDSDVRHIQLYYGFDNLTVQEIDEMNCRERKHGKKRSCKRSETSRCHNRH
ncbi:hypothetical protein [Paenibacillus sp. QZ-Y1]|uniref:hypothetical protein n=1 Tax=Paenibacillus sp. QZ-Y1 TaxID=3414511 RepID=UPI003F7982F9